MSSEKDISWLGRRKERKALELCLDHLEKTVEAADLMNEVVHSFATGEGDIGRRKEATLEKEKAATLSTLSTYFLLDPIWANRSQYFLANCSNTLSFIKPRT